MTPSASTPTDLVLTAVDAALGAELSRRHTELTAADPRVAGAADRLADFLAGGKRIRPAFCWWGWRAAGGRAEVADCGPVLQVAAALELLQACALIHDDLIDRSDTRRGRPAVHRAAAADHRGASRVGDADQYGAGYAVLLGDLALAWADDLFVTGALRLDALVRAQPVWSAMRTEVLAGQLLDILVAADATGDPAAQESDALAVIRLKTASYTVLRPLLLGAALAGVDAPTRQALAAYGAAVGTAFQLRDDLLGVFGDPAVTGKPAGDDLREGKRTMVLAAARAGLAASGRDDDLAALDAGIGAVVGDAEVQRLGELIASTGAVADVEDRITSLVAAADRSIADLPDEPRAALSELAHRFADPGFAPVPGGPSGGEQ